MKRKGIGVLLAGGVLFYLWAWPPSWLQALGAGDIQGVAKMLASYGPWAVVVSLLFSLGVALGTFLPSIAVSGANAIIFGPFWGGVISWIGEVLGAALTYWVYRFLGFSRGMEKPSLPPYLDRFGGGRGWRWVLVARLTPMAPSGVVTLGAAWAAVPFWPFLGATAVGKIPSISLEVFMAYGLISGKVSFQVILLLAAAGLIWWWWKKF